MPAQRVHVPIPKLARLDNVEIFATGTYRGRKYSVDDLHDIVRNFNTFSVGRNCPLTVTSVPGHEEDQSLLKNTGLPSFGKADRLRVVGDKLVADFSEMPIRVAQLVNQRAYRRVSAEIYADSKPSGIDAKGMILKRVAFLGGEMPHLKNLLDLPMAYVPEDEPQAQRWPTTIRPSADATPFSETSAGTVVCFSEVVRMNRDELIKALVALNVKREVAELCSDQVMAEWLQSLQECQAQAQAQAQAQQQQEESAEPQEPMEGNEMEPNKDDAKGKEAPVAKPVDVNNFAEEISKAIEQALAPHRKAIDEANDAAKRLRVETAVQKFSDRIMPWELDATAGLPTLKDQLYKLDDTDKCHKFAENGVTLELSDFEAALKILEKRPVNTSKEIIRQGNDSGPDRKAQVLAYAERHRADWESFGQTPEMFVETWEQSSPAQKKQLESDLGMPV